MATNKITKKLKFEDIKRAINGEPMLYIDKATAINFIDNELALIVKKNTKAKNPEKPSAKQVENNGYKDSIIAYMEDRGCPVTCSELHEKIPEFQLMTVQKVVSLVCSLAKEGKIVKQTENNTVYWAIVTE